jgi:WD40 repeat protein
MRSANLVLSLQLKYTKKVLKTLLSLDYSDERTLRTLYESLPQKEDQPLAIPNHILGYSSDFVYVDRKLTEYSMMDDKQRQKEHLRWQRLSEWEREMYTKQANEIMKQRRQIKAGLNVSSVSPPRATQRSSTKRESCPEKRLRRRGLDETTSSLTNIDPAQQVPALVSDTALLAPIKRTRSLNVGSMQERHGDRSASREQDRVMVPVMRTVSANLLVRPKKFRHGSRSPAVPAIPTSVWVDHILPLLDRPEWNATTSTCKELYTARRYTMPPWPETLLGTSCNVRSLTFSSNGQFVAFASPNGAIQVFDRRYGCETLHQAGDDTIVPTATSSSNNNTKEAAVCCFSPTGTTLACSYENMVVVWEIKSQPRPEEPKTVNAKLQLKRPRDMGVKSTTSASKQYKHRIAKLLSYSGNKRATCLAFSPNGDILVAAVSDSNAEDNTSDLHFWNLQDNGRHIGSVASLIGLFSLAFSSDGLTLAGATQRAGVSRSNEIGTIFVWDVSSLAESVLTQKSSGSVRLLPTPVDLTPRMIHPLLHEYPLTGISYSNDGRFLASSHTSGCIVLWSVADNYEYAGEYVASESGTTATSLAFSPTTNGATKLVCGKSDGTIKVLNVDTNESRVVHQESNPVAIEGLAFSPDGEMLVSATNGGLVRLSKWVEK